MLSSCAGPYVHNRVLCEVEANKSRPFSVRKTLHMNPSNHGAQHSPLGHTAHCIGGLLFCDTQAAPFKPRRGDVQSAINQHRVHERESHDVSGSQLRGFKIVMIGSVYSEPHLI